MVEEEPGHQIPANPFALPSEGPAQTPDHPFPPAPGTRDTPHTPIPHPPPAGDTPPPASGRADPDRTEFDSLDAPDASYDRTRDLTAPDDDDEHLAAILAPIGGPPADDNSPSAPAPQVGNAAPVATRVVRETYAVPSSIAHLPWELERFPWHALSDQAAGARIDRAPAADGRPVTDGGWVATAVDSPRLPGPGDADLWVAIGSFYNQEWLQSRRHPGTIRIPVGALLPLLRRNRDGRTDAALAASLARLSAVEIASTAHYARALGDCATWRLLEGHFAPAPSGDWRAHALVVTLTQHVVQLMAARSPRLLDTNVYFAIEGPLARRLYRYLECRRWRGSNPQRQVRLRLAELAADLPTSIRATGMLHQQLRKAHAELQAIGYLTETPVFKRSDRYGTAYETTDVSYSLRPHPREAGARR